MKRFFLFLILLTARTAYSQSSDAPAFTLPFYADVTALAGGATTGGGATGSQSATIIRQGIGATLAANFSGILVGGVFEYQNFQQFSSVDSSTGNYSGNRVVLAPMIGLKFNTWLLKVDYQMSGDLNLTNLTANGATMQYSNAQGYQVDILYNLIASLFVGLQVENVQFGSVQRTDTGSSTLQQKLSVTDASVVASWVF